MATKTRRTADDFRSDIAAKHGGTTLSRTAPLPPRSHNTPGLPALTQAENVYGEEARTAMASIRKTFEFWVVIGRFLKILHTKAEASGGKKTYDRLRERERLGKDVINKTRSSRLLAIIDRLTEVGKWRDDLTDKQCFEWASPEAVHRHCPIFQKPKPTTAGPTSGIAQKATAKPAKPALIVTEERTGIRFAAIPGSREVYEFRLVEGGVAVFGGDLKPRVTWEVKRTITEIEVPEKQYNRSEIKNAEERKKRDQARIALREKYFKKALAAAQADYGVRSQQQHSAAGRRGVLPPRGRPAFP